MPKNKRQNKKKKPVPLSKMIIDLFGTDDRKPLNLNQIAFRLGFQGKKQRKALEEALKYLVESNHLVEPSQYRFQLASKQKYQETGVIEITRGGYGFVTVEGKEEDIFVPASRVWPALHGDTVLVEIRKGFGKKPEGVIKEIVKRAKERFVGVIEVRPTFAFFRPDNFKVHVDFYISLSRIKGAEDGDKVIVEMTDWPEGSKSPFGKVVEVLGKAGDHEVEIHAIMEEFDLPYKFPKEIEEKAERIPDTIPENEYPKRKDFRDTLTFTIDPPDAKDFDDAISFRRIEDNKFEIGVHIADVSWYVTKNSDIDKDALERATSVYLVDRVVPMLPEHLSNHLCSLNPNEDKLCFAIVFEIDRKGKIYSEWIGRTVINSDKRFSYDEVQEILDQKTGLFEEELKICNEIATSLREKRYQEGSIYLETDEVKFRLDETGKPIEVFKLERKESHMLIEDFMLLANRRIATFVTNYEKKKHPMVYRIHSLSNEEKILNFERIAGVFGYHLDRTDSKKYAISLNKLLKETEGKPEQNFLTTLALRTMEKAKYSPDNIGHYGLAFDFYTHFTSPIRRYPDLMVHRILADILETENISYGKEELVKLSKHCSEREIVAEMAERASVKYKQVEFMKDKIGQSFMGIISGVIESGFFVEIIENKCEGFISIGSLDDDVYVYSEENYEFKGHHYGKIFRIGSEVEIIITKADLIKKQLDFTLKEN